jgi:hypothetical protein
MNERIKELWEQCKTPDWHQDNPTYDHEKFAELIVLKCAEIGQQYADGNYEVFNQILEHFGLEEE